MPRLAALLILLTAAAPGRAAPSDSPVTAASQPSAGSSPAGSAAGDLRTLAGQLSSPQFRQRQQAFELLLDSGKEGLPALMEAVRSPDREARSRALSILVALAASRNEALSAAAQKALDRLASIEDRAISRDVTAALVEARLARAFRAIAAIRAGGGAVTTDQGDEPTADAPLAVQIGASWKHGSGGLRMLADLPAVTWLSLESAPIDDADLTYVGQLANLEKLYLKDTDVRGPGLAQLSGLGKLTHLSLRELPIDDAALAGLPELPQLTNLGLDYTQVSDAGLAELKRLGPLETLWLDHTKITDAGLAELKELPKLRTLYLIATKTGGPGLASLKELPSLRFLSLKEVQLAPGATRHLAQIGQLEILGLDHTNVTDEQLADLAALSNLRTLWLSKTPVTDAGIEHLKKLKSLQLVYFHGSQVTPAGREALRKALPGCKVEPEDDKADQDNRGRK